MEIKDTHAKEYSFPDCFPASPKPCAEITSAFFNCITLHSKKLDKDDKDAGIRGMKQCIKEKIAYEECVENFNINNKNAIGKNSSLNRFRVQEEYQLKSNAKNNSDIK